ncbi:MAG: antibiotic biosynthesis monooxygenase [Pseudonocardiaceae bacterium]
MTITVRAEFRAVLPENTERFAHVGRALEEAAAGEAATLRYRWYEAEDPGTFVVLEEYIDPAAAIAHNKHCDALIRQMDEVAEMTSAQLHGHLGPELEAWVADHPQAHAYTPMQHR